MADNKVEKQVGSLLKAQERLGVTLVKERDKKRRRRDGRLLKLGVLAEQMFLAGDLPLLARFEQAALEQFKDRKVDRLDFELDETFNWFDKTREDAMAAKASKGDANKSAAAPTATAAAGATTAGKPGMAPSQKPAANGAGGANGTNGSTASNNTASA